MTDIDIAYRSASELLRDLRSGRAGSRDLLESYLARIASLDGALNAVVSLDLESARRRADEADRARRGGESWGPLHGLPMTIKDTWEVPGMVCSAGAPEYAEHRPEKAARAVQRLLDAGAIVFGKTNVPYKAMDIQSYNSVFGTANNPWNTERTPGGSSGGAAAALAAGFTPLELGSDIGGSIRIPAHFCGVYGHKVTHGIVSMRGHIPGPPGSISEPALGVAGPMARTAEDLRMMFDLLTTPSEDGTPGWRLGLPEPRRQRVDELSVLMWIDDPDCPIDPRMSEVYAEVARRLREAGARVELGSPLGMGLKDIYPFYTAQMGCLMKAWLTGAERRRFGMVAPLGGLTPHLLRGLGNVVSLPKYIHRFVEGLTMDHGDWLDLVEDSDLLREEFVKVFQRYDVILSPPTIGTAFPHDHSLFAARRLIVDGRPRHYADQFMWISPATLMGLPSTSAPVGSTRDGAPVNVQIVGAPYEDKTTIHVAELLGTVCGGFRPPEHLESRAGRAAP